MEGITALAAGLAQNPNLTTLDLQDNTLSVDGSLAVSRALPVWKDLKELNLSDCFLTRRGGIALATALQNGSSPDLEVLRLQYGEMDKRSFEILAKAIKLHLPGLKTVELNGNLVDAEDESVEKIREALEAHGNEGALDERETSDSNSVSEAAAEILLYLSAVDDMEEDEGEEEEEDAASDAEEEDATKEGKEPTVAEPSSEKVPEEKSILEFSVDDMADALSKMTVVKE